MKLLMTADTVGGVWTYALELARALAPHDVRVVLATMGGEPTAAQRDEAAAAGNVDLRTSALRLEWMEEPWADVEAAGEWLLSLEREVRPDIVHLNGYVHGALPWRRKPIVVGHSCVLSWWRAVKGEDAPPSWARYAREVAAGVRAAAHVVAPTRAMLDALELHYGPLPPASVILNGRDPALFPPGRKRPMVLAAGRIWDEAKNIALLEAVAPRLPWPVCIAGEHRHPDGACAGVSHARARFLGLLPPREMARHLAEASIYALPARYEPFGLSALEAALAGCALVLGDIPSLREVWGTAAVFVPPHDADALEAAILSLIENAPRRARLAEQARRRALELSPQRMAQQYLRLYGLAPAPSSPGPRPRSRITISRGAGSPSPA